MFPCSHCNADSDEKQGRHGHFETLMDATFQDECPAGTSQSLQAGGPVLVQYELTKSAKRFTNFLTKKPDVRAYRQD